MSGFAVIDLETTGFAYDVNDRVCEIGVVLVDGAGRGAGPVSKPRSQSPAQRAPAPGSGPSLSITLAMRFAT